MICIGQGNVLSDARNFLQKNVIVSNYWTS